MSPDQRDPVEDFFARERAAVTPSPGSEEHWAAIVEQARPRRRWPAYLGGAAAAAVLVGALGVGWLVQGRDDGRDQVVASSSSVTTPAAGPSAGATTGPSRPGGTPGRTPGGTPGGPGAVLPPGDGAATSGPGSPRALPVPTTFGLLSMSNAGGGAVYALGSADCAGVLCPVVIGSSDDGRSWTTRASLTQVAPAQGRAGLWGLRFASREVGFAYGRGLQVTRDGGATWEGLDYGGGVVTSLETDGRTVWLAVAEQCLATTCSGRVSVRSLPVQGAVAATPVYSTTLAAPQPLSNLWLAMDGPTAYLNVYDAAARAVRLTAAGGVEQLALPTGCPARSRLVVAAAAGARGAVFGLCARPDGSGHSVFRSGDGGASWSPGSTGDLGPSGGLAPRLAATDGSHLVVAFGVRAGQPEDTATRVGASDDGGATFRELPQSGKVRWEWLGSPGGRSLYAVQPGGLSYWLSSDSGASFRAVALR